MAMYARRPVAQIFAAGAYIEMIGKKREFGRVLSDDNVRRLRLARDGMFVHDFLSRVEESGETRRVARRALRRAIQEGLIKVKVMPGGDL